VKFSVVNLMSSPNKPEQSGDTPVHVFNPETAGKVADILLELERRQSSAAFREFPYAAAVPKLYQLPALKKLNEATQTDVYQQAEKAIRTDWRVRLAMLGWFAVFLAYAVGLGFAKYEGAKILFPALAWVLCWRFIRRQLMRQRMRQLALEALQRDMMPAQAS
jgi:lipopolysaccharide export LptBFGC system permease protein LptF